MHEFSLATQIVESVLALVETQDAGEVLQVRLQIGELACVEAEQLRFCFHSITRQTPLENTALEIEPLAAEVRCPHCRYEGPPKYWTDAREAGLTPTLQCPQCGQATGAMRGHECTVKSVRFVRRQTVVSQDNAGGLE